MKVLEVFVFFAMFEAYSDCLIVAIEILLLDKDGLLLAGNLD